MEAFKERTLRKDLNRSKKEKLSTEEKGQQSQEVHVQWYEEGAIRFVENDHEKIKKVEKM